MAKPKTEQSKPTKVTHPVLRAIMGIVAILAILVFSNWLVRSTSLGNKTIDLTEHKRHTLTDGTKSILQELETPVIIRYYATRKSEAMPRRVKNYMRKVDGLLENYKRLSGGKIQIENFDPQPDTDAEDSANMDGIAGQRLEDENLYFGLSISSLDQQTTIPFLDPTNDTVLEYQLSSAIASVTTFEKPAIGIMTTLPLAGSPPAKPGEQGQPPWAMFELLRQRYNLYYLGMQPKELDPETTPVLLLVHPAGITPEVEYKLDQYLLQGGVIVACLDPFSLRAPASDPRMPASMSGAVPKHSTFPQLLTTWGIGFDAFSVLADGKYATDGGGGQRLHAHLTLNPDAIVSEDEVITLGFENLYFALAGGFTVNEEVPGLTVDTLVETSDQVIRISGPETLNNDERLFSRKQPAGKTYGLVMRVQGEFKTAFPDGAPEEKTEDAKDAESTQTNEEQDAHLTKSNSSSTVYLISDADFLVDGACFHRTQQEFTAVNNNAALLQNILDQCIGSKHLIGSRSRAATTRPFTAVKEMEISFEKDMHEDVEAARLAINQITQQLEAIQQQQSSGNSILVSPEQGNQIRALLAEHTKLRKDLREKEKGLRERKNKLYAKITWLTVASTPLFVALCGLVVWLVRRRSTRAI